MSKRTTRSGRQETVIAVRVVAPDELAPNAQHPLMGIGDRAAPFRRALGALATRCAGDPRLVADPLDHQGRPNEP